MRSENKWLKIQQNTEDCPKCRYTWGNCKCPKKQGGSSSDAQEQAEEAISAKSHQVEPYSDAPTLKPSDAFSLTFTPNARKTERNDEDEIELTKKEKVKAYEAIASFEDIIKEFENFLAQLAEQQKTTVAELQKQGYRHEVRGNVLALYFPNKSHAQTFAQMLEDKGMVKKLGSEATPQPRPGSSKEEASEDDEYQSPTPFGRIGQLPQLTK